MIAILFKLCKYTEDLKSGSKPSFRVIKGGFEVF